MAKKKLIKVSAKAKKTAVTRTRGAVLRRDDGRLGPRKMKCPVSKCRGKTKGPRYNYYCEAHEGRSVSAQAAGLTKAKAKAPRTKKAKAKFASKAKAKRKPKLKGDNNLTFMGSLPAHAEVPPPSAVTVGELPLAHSPPCGACESDEHGAVVVPVPVVESAPSHDAEV